MKNKALIITIISFFGIIILLTLLFVTDFNLFASIPILITLLSSFTLGLCSCMIGTFEKSAKLFAIISIVAFFLTALTLFNPDLYLSFWHVVFLIHIGLITWTLVQITPTNIPVLMWISRISIILTAVLFGTIILGNIGSTIVFSLLKIGLFVSSATLILQFILQSKLNKV